ncbi:dTDP-4-amino-4,6-dideoxygalactose transaminase [Ekhidna sp.]|uniref:dTDP-4-amino-4,6-dideoxygalactose transaminase n=1 Tax=Ekhidna sp. TaxID=2608089 RepID=UPI003CCBF023
MEILFNKPLILGNEKQYIDDLIHSGNKFSGDGSYTKACNQKLEEITKTKKALLTTSCTHALEMAAILIDIKPGDEVIMSSFTFVSTANPFVLRGAKIVFVDVRPDTMNIDETQIEAAITPKTKAIVPVHYGAVGCEMKTINNIAERHGLWVVEDAAQCIDSYYQGKHLGTIGHLGAISFHDTKNIHCGEGGCLLINDERLLERAEIIREKGTNRAKFIRGEIDKYSWVDAGSSYLPSELNAAFLMAQLEKVKQVTMNRLQSWRRYRELLAPLVKEGCLEWQDVQGHCKHNGHLFYIKLPDLKKRTSAIQKLRKNKISAVFHYIPLHSSIAGREYGVFIGEDKYTTKESERLLRLPMWFGLQLNDQYISKLKKCLD